MRPDVTTRQGTFANEHAVHIGEEQRELETARWLPRLPPTDVIRTLHGTGVAHTYSSGAG
jgi:hypothetical protein